LVFSSIASALAMTYLAERHADLGADPFVHQIHTRHLAVVEKAFLVFAGAVSLRCQVLVVPSQVGVQCRAQEHRPLGKHLRRREWHSWRSGGPNRSDESGEQWLQVGTGLDGEVLQIRDQRRLLRQEPKSRSWSSSSDAEMPPGSVQALMVCARSAFTYEQTVRAKNRLFVRSVHRSSLLFAGCLRAAEVAARSTRTKKTPVFFWYKRAGRGVDMCTSHVYLRKEKPLVNH
jgi:hypothetical protein